MRSVRHRRLTAVAGLGAGYLLSEYQRASAQHYASAGSRFAAVATERGGQDIFGAYEPVVGWPKGLETLPGHEAWTIGVVHSVFAESANRVFVLQRGELPVVPMPEVRKLGPSVWFPLMRLPWRSASNSSPPANGATGQLAETAWKTWEDRGNRLGVDGRWEHCILVYDRRGTLIEAWTQWDTMLQRPHFVSISPYDPQKHVWIVDDHKHAIFKFTSDGKRLVQTIGTVGVPGADAMHFNRPSYLAWLPDGGFVVADGYNGTRVVKFDGNGTFLKAWGQRGESGNETRPSYFNNVHGIAVDPATRRIFVNDRNNGRIQVFDENGVFLDQWSTGERPTSDVHMFHLMADGYLWAADRGTNRIVKWDLSGNFIYSLGHLG